jgi:hypothetical protein
MFPKLLRRFGITLNDSLITDLPVSSKDMLGIQVNQAPVPGMVSLYEEHSVRTEVGYTINEWYAMKPENRAYEVAISRIKGAVEYQKNKEQNRRMEAESRRKK